MKFVFREMIRRLGIQKVARPQFKVNNMNNNGEWSTLQMRLRVEWDSRSTAISTEPLSGCTVLRDKNTGPPPPNTLVLCCIEFLEYRSRKRDKSLNKNACKAGGSTQAHLEPRKTTGYHRAQHSAQHITGGLSSVSITSS